MPRSKNSNDFRAWANYQDTLDEPLTEEEIYAICEWPSPPSAIVANVPFQCFCPSHYVHRCGPTPRYVCPSAAWQESIQGIDLSSPEYAAKALAAMEAEKERFRAQEAAMEAEKERFRAQEADTGRGDMRWDEEDDSPPDAARIEAATKLLEAGAAAAAYTAARRLAAEESDLCRCDPQYNPCSKCASREI